MNRNPKSCSGNDLLTTTLTKSYKKIIATIFAAIAVIVSVPVGASPDILSAQRLMVGQKYPEAIAQARAVLRNDPDNIDAIYALAAIEQTRILDYESYMIDGKRFQTFADSLIKILESAQPRLSGEDSLRCLFYRANIMGGVGLMQAKRGSWIDGARSGMAAQNLYKQVKRIDPDHRGADLGMGVYDYYLGTGISKIPLVTGGSVERGIEALERALHAPFPFNHAAKSSYCWILIDRKQFRRADSLARAALKDAPGSTIFLRIRAHIALWTGSYNDALTISKKWLAASESRTPVNWSDVMSSHYIIASAHDNLGQKNEAYAVAVKALELPVPDTYKNTPHVKEHIKVLTNIRSKHRPK